jgi:multisubunit Na+/H+ antiporter MnhE subunit
VNRSWLRGASEALTWSGAAFGLWLISLSAVSNQEILIAALASLPCGAAAVGARLAVRDSWTLRPGWLKPALQLPLSLVTDAVQVFAACVPFRRRPGRFETVPTGAGGDTARARSQRAVWSALISVTPGSYVLDVDEESGDMLVHSLAHAGPQIAAAVSRMHGDD